MHVIPANGPQTLNSHYGESLWRCDFLDEHCSTTFLTEKANQLIWSWAKQIRSARALPVTAKLLWTGAATDAPTSARSHQFLWTTHRKPRMAEPEFCQDPQRDWRHRFQISSANLAAPCIGDNPANKLRTLLQTNRGNSEIQEVCTMHNAS